MPGREIALIEFAGSHAECLFTQVLFLKESGHTVHIIIREDQSGRIPRFPEADYWKFIPKARSWLGMWRVVFEVGSYLRKRRIRIAVLNTAQGNMVRKFCLFSRRSLHLSGILHNADKLWTSSSQRIISRKIRRYNVLADYIHENLSGEQGMDRRLKISFFYPVYFPVKDLKAPEADGDFRIVIPGGVEYRRRDYGSLLEEIGRGDLPGNVRFILLGRTDLPDGKDLLARIRNEGMERYFEFYDEFIPHDEFHRVLSGCDLVLPLITPGTQGFNEYLMYKVTGAYNLAFGHRVPLLLHEALGHIGSFRETALFYAEGRLLETIRQLYDDRASIAERRKKIQESRLFNFDDQRERYIKLVIP